MKWLVMWYYDIMHWKGSIKDLKITSKLWESEKHTKYYLIAM